MTALHDILSAFKNPLASSANGIGVLVPERAGTQLTAEQRQAWQRLIDEELID